MPANFHPSKVIPPNELIKYKPSSSMLRTARNLLPEIDYAFIWLVGNTIQGMEKVHIDQQKMAGSDAVLQAQIGGGGKTTFAMVIVKGACNHKADPTEQTSVVEAVRTAFQRQFDEWKRDAQIHAYEVTWS